MLFPRPPPSDDALLIPLLDLRCNFTRWGGGYQLGASAPPVHFERTAWLPARRPRPRAQPPQPAAPATSASAAACDDAGEGDGPASGRCPADMDAGAAVRAAPRTPREALAARYRRWLGLRRARLGPAAARRPGRRRRHAWWWGWLVPRGW